MNLWRVPIDEATGRRLGPPEAVTFGAASEIHSASVSRDGRKIVNVASVTFNSIRKVSLDVDRGRNVVDPAPLFRGSSPILWLDLAPDDRSLAYTTIGAGDSPGMVREEIVIVPMDGSSRRLVAVSDSRNRMPCWSPSGDRIAFASDRSGSYKVYTVRSDGSDLQPIEPRQENTLYPVWSPSGDRMAYCILDRRFRTLISRWPPAGRPAEEIPALPDAEENFVPADWSPDGTLLAGYRDRARGGFDSFGLAVTRDGRTVYLTEVENEADLWLLDLE